MGCGDSTSGGGSRNPALRAAMEGDMSLLHEGVGYRLTDPTWDRVPRLNPYGYPAEWNVAMVWGHMFATQDAPNPDINYPEARVHVKDLQLWVYTKGGSWRLVQEAESPNGHLYNFDTDIATYANMHVENGGGVSAKAGGNYWFHFYPHSQETFDRSDVAGYLAVFQARLVGQGDPRYLVGAGLDLWESMTTMPPSAGVNKADVGIGRLKYVTHSWQYFTMHTFTADELANMLLPGESPSMEETTPMCKLFHTC